MSYKIPIDTKGNMMRYNSAHDAGQHRAEEIDNLEWVDELQYVTYGRGRSAAYFEFKSLRSGLIYSVFMTDFHKMLKRMTYGGIGGTFTYVKRGSNYGIKLVDE